MAAPNPTYTQPIAVDTIDYKPLALLAVAGFVFSLIFGVLLVFSMVVALLKGEPFFLPGWMLVFPIGGAVLSAAAMWQISNSEGTRAGTKLAKWGLLLSVFGLVYVTYQTFTGLAIVSQANRFMLEKDPDSGFLPRVKGSDVDLKTAFLYWLKANERANARADSEKDMQRFDQPGPQSPKGRLTVFMDSPLVRIIRQASPDTVKFEALEVKSWSYDNRAYKVERKYRITTEEGVYEVPFIITSQEAEAQGEKRKWQVEWQVNAPLQPITRTELGLKRNGFRQRTFEFLAHPSTGWFPSLRAKDGVKFFLDTEPPAVRAEWKDKVLRVLASTPVVAAAGTAAALQDAKAAEELLKKMPAMEAQAADSVLKSTLKGYMGLEDAAKFFGTDKLRFPFDPKSLPLVQDALAKTLAPEKRALLVIKIQPDEYAPCEVKNGQLHVTHDFEFLVFITKEGMRGEVVVAGKVVVVAPDNLDLNAPGADQQFRVQSAELLRALPMMGKQGPQ
jgi:hypothetical protein